MGILSWYVTSHPGQLHLLPSVGWKTSNGKSVMILHSREVKASMAYSMCALKVWEADKTAWPLLIHTTPQPLETDIIYKHTQTTVLWPFFQDYPGEPVPEENHLLDFMVQGEISEANTPTIRLCATPSRLISDPPPSSPIFMPEALCAATFPIYPGLGQAPNMLACIPSVKQYFFLFCVWLLMINLLHLIWTTASSSVESRLPPHNNTEFCVISFLFWS